jgi:hypothetical protein
MQNQAAMLTTTNGGLGDAFPWYRASNRSPAVFPIRCFPAHRKGHPAEVGLTGGTDANWDYFSVQWDGYLQVLKRSCPDENS